jgi:hypothetical protein
MKIGDRILTADGQNVRYLYEAKRSTLYKQPGDTITFVVQRIKPDAQARDAARIESPAIGRTDPIRPHRWKSSASWSRPRST